MRPYSFGRLSKMRTALPSERSIVPGATASIAAVTPISDLMRCARAWAAAARVAWEPS